MSKKPVLKLEKVSSTSWESVEVELAWASWKRNFDPRKRPSLGHEVG
jgi:hypothetical protein